MSHFKQHRKYYIGVAVLLVLSLIYARLYLNVWALDYVNRTLQAIPGHIGSVADLDIHLYRGAYTIHQLQVRKLKSGIPEPFIDIGSTDLSIQWGALFKGRIVSDVHMVKPELNFAASQTGKETNWMEPIRELMPIDINIVTIKDGNVAYRDYSASPDVNMFIHNVQGELRNLQNVEDKKNALPSSISIRGTSIGGGALSLQGNMNVLKPVMDMDMNIKLDNMDLTAVNDYTNHAAGIDFVKGKLSVYSEVIVKDKQLSGYVKPLASDIEVVSLKQDDNPVEIVWESMASVFMQLFKNHPNDRFATKAPLSGSFENIETNSWAAIAGIFRNTFVKAFTEGLDQDVQFSNQ
ncbi:MAG: DUF748 domain-containing protein [Alphaproteobacteria bacterium]